MKVEKFHTDIKKEPGRVFMKEFEKNKEGMTEKFILHFTYMHKTFDTNGNGLKKIILLQL
jgi:hypothetical protein